MSLPKIQKYLDWNPPLIIVKKEGFIFRIERDNINIEHDHCGDVDVSIELLRGLVGEVRAASREQKITKP